MLTHVRNWSLRLFAASLVLATLPVSADDSEGVVRISQTNTPGVVRITDAAQSEQVLRGQSAEYDYAQDIELVGHARRCQHGVPMGATNCPTCCPEGPCSWLSWNMQLCCMRHHQACAVLKESCREDLREKCAYLRCKFGYFCPSGGDGSGVAPIGCYKMVYPVNPYHFDPRDGNVYAAPGYGGPVSVPLAPVVENTYNYGWGVPSSRLTRVAQPLSPGVSVR